MVNCMCQVSIPEEVLEEIQHTIAVLQNTVTQKDREIEKLQANTADYAASPVWPNQ